MGAGADPASCAWYPSFVSRAADACQTVLLRILVVLRPLGTLVANNGTDHLGCGFMDKIDWCCSLKNVNAHGIAQHATVLGAFDIAEFFFHRN